MNEKNAVITSVSLSRADHGVLSMWLMLDYGGTAQGFGGYNLYLPKSFTHCNNQWNYAGHFIYRCLEIAGVDRLQQLKGKTIRVRLDSPYGSIISIGHIVKDDWFDPKKDFTEIKEER